MLDDDVRASGRCLCGQISYQVRGPLRSVLVCHCEDCRRWHGHVSAMTSARREHVIVNVPDRVGWYTIPADAPRPWRGFCPTCGSSLFWDAPERATIGITAGTLDQPTGLETAGHVYVGEAADYEVLADDGLPRRTGEAAVEAASPPPG